MTKIEQIERKRLYNKLNDEIATIINSVMDTLTDEVALDALVKVGCILTETVNRYALASELTPTLSDDESAITLTRRVVASLGMSGKLEGRKLDYEQCCQIIISIVTSLRDQQKQLKETLRKLNKDYNIQTDWYLDAKGKRQEYQRTV